MNEANELTQKIQHLDPDMVMADGLPDGWIDQIEASPDVRNLFSMQNKMLSALFDSAGVALAVVDQDIDI